MIFYYTHKSVPCLEASSCNRYKQTVSHIENMQRVKNLGTLKMSPSNPSSQDSENTVEQEAGAMDDDTKETIGPHIYTHSD